MGRPTRRGYHDEVGLAPWGLTSTVAWSHLSLAPEYDALSYYHDDKGEVNALIRRKQTAAVRRTIPL